ncbi:adenosine deaminase domain-containing protein 1 [Gouania willdenowi]|uniref:Adenosine deaminase domain-containing protein 1 n=1 Tax=Gouania willdenowi TaxID=441366 RepID=A0A8C5GFF7_GOUWI|nr:adenosine deaminase domain-containing protein 1 [Gouania willdenowi]
MLPGHGPRGAQGLNRNTPQSLAQCKDDQRSTQDQQKNYFMGKDHPKVPPEVLIAKYKEGETHAVSLLHQLSVSLEFQLEIKETVTPANVQGFYFAFCVVMDGVVYPTGWASTKKEARLAAARLALQKFLPTLENQKPGSPESWTHGESLPNCPPLLPVREMPALSGIQPRKAIPERTHPVFLQIQLAVKNYVTKLLNSNPEFSTQINSMAAFIVQTSNSYEVVAFGTGNFNTNSSVWSSGRTVYDSHAVVTARRSLMRFLYRHLLMFFSSDQTLIQNSIFQLQSASSLLSLKSDITLHLYVNQLPKGASQIPQDLKPLSVSAWEGHNELSLHMIIEGKVYSVYSSDLDYTPSKVVSMSTTDKITQWQVLGYQGALLSHFIEPIYVQTILIGDTDGSEIRGLEVSVNQRVAGITPQLPTFYCVVRPYISLVSSVVTNSLSTCNVTHSINWSEGDSSVEVVDALEGKTIEESPFKSGSALASRLCKAAMLYRFKLVAKEAKRQDLLSSSSYREAKRMAKPYQEAKSVLHAHLLQQGFGSWINKVAEHDNLTM